VPARVKDTPSRYFSVEPIGIVVFETAGAALPGRLQALEHVANQPIAEHVLDELVSAGVREVVVATCAKVADEVRRGLAERVRNDGLRLHYVEQQAPLNLAAALSLAAPTVADAPCIAHLANGLLGRPLAPFAQRMHAGGPDALLIVHPGTTPDEPLSTSMQDMLHIAEVDPARPALGVTGVWLFGPGALRRGCPDPASGGDPDVTMVAERITAAGGSLHVELVDSWRRYAGNPVDLLDLNRIALDALEPDLLRSANQGNNRIEGRVRIDEGADVRGSVVVGPTVIGPGAHVADAYIGPYTSIGAGARVEGTEIERSIICAGASIMHIGGRLAASVVGRDARVFRDFSLPRALRLQVGEGTEVGLC
jgi:glucose-1-phosphate thymidylyltransferase